MLELDKIYNMDCLDGMKQIDDNSIDMILCDLPYGTTACDWDSIIPLDVLWEQYKRIIKGTTPIVLTASQPFTSALIMNDLEMFREEIIWLKNRGASGLTAKQKHIKLHENIIIFSPSGTYTYNPQKWKVCNNSFLTKRKTFDKFEIANNEIYSKIIKKRKPDDGYRNPISIISYSVPITMSNDKSYKESIEIRVHPTQKPLGLFEYLVKTYSNEGDLILDNCMGSGTTAVACKRLNRRFIGFEINPNYCKMANKRLEQEYIN